MLHGPRRCPYRVYRLKVQAPLVEVWKRACDDEQRARQWERAVRVLGFTELEASHLVFQRMVSERAGETGQRRVRLGAERLPRKEAP